MNFTDLDRRALEVIGQHPWITSNGLADKIGLASRAYGG